MGRAKEPHPHPHLRPEPYPRPYPHLGEHFVPATAAPPRPAARHSGTSGPRKDSPR